MAKPDCVNKVSAQNLGVEIYSGRHDHPNGLEEDFSRIDISENECRDVALLRLYKDSG
ncbi:hypothetical protein [Nostoc sp.]|uniref:hypothetical protein n=1 Tax=Nostoc sp. TaxID=1180 RepID=UPI002FEFE66B